MLWVECLVTYPSGGGEQVLIGRRQARHERGEFAAGELSLERFRRPLVAGLEGEETLGDLSSEEKLFGVSTLRCTIEK